MSLPIVPLTIIGGALVVTGAVLFIAHKLRGDKEEEEPKAPEKPRPEGCCGTHMVCEKLDQPVANIYFDDEELDAFAGRDPKTYTEDEIRMFEDVYNTMQRREVYDWMKALELRRVRLPEHIYDEIMFLMVEMPISFFKTDHKDA